MLGGMFSRGEKLGTCLKSRILLLRRTNEDDTILVFSLMFCRNVNVDVCHRLKA